MQCTQGCLLGAHCAALASIVLRCRSKVVVKASDGAQQQQKEASLLCTPLTCRSSQAIKSQPFWAQQPARDRS